MKQQQLCECFYWLQYSMYFETTFYLMPDGHVYGDSYRWNTECLLNPQKIGLDYSDGDSFDEEQFKSVAIKVLELDLDLLDFGNTTHVKLIQTLTEKFIEWLES